MATVVEGLCGWTGLRLPSLVWQPLADKGPCDTGAEPEDVSVMSIPWFASARSEKEIQGQLAADLVALAPSPGEAPARGDVLTRPSILRRLTQTFGSVMVPEAERIVSPSVDLALAVSTALTFGIPFAVVERSGAVEFGELHRSERVVVVALSASDAQWAAGRARRLGADVISVAGVSLFGEHAGTLDPIAPPEEQK